MALSRFIVRRTADRLTTALRLARWWPAAARLVATDAMVESGPIRAAAPYDPLLVDRLKRLVARVDRTALGERGAIRAVAASFLECRRLGWNCALHLGGPAYPTWAQLDLWGTPVLTAGEPGTDTRCAARWGDPLTSVPARWPAGGDSTVGRTRTGGDLPADLRRLLDDLGGLETLITPGARVLLKANFNSYHAPPASTGLDLLTAAVGALREAGAAEIALGECSALALGRTRAVLRRAGLPGWAEAHGVQLRCFDEEPWQVCAVPGRHFREIIVPACLPEFDQIIYLLAAKTHRMAGVSLGLKMTIGFMHPAQRLELHRDHLVERIADASLAVRPDLAILDARQCFVTGGPAEGTVATPGLLLAARQLEPLEEAGLGVLAHHQAVGLDLGSEQLACAISLRAKMQEGEAGRRDEERTR